MRCFTAVVMRRCYTAVTASVCPTFSINRIDFMMVFLPQFGFVPFHFNQFGRILERKSLHQGRVPEASGIQRRHSMTLTAMSEVAFEGCPSSKSLGFSSVVEVYSLLTFSSDSVNFNELF